MRYEGHEASPPRSLNNLKTAAQLVKSIFTTKKKNKEKKEEAFILCLDFINQLYFFFGSMRLRGDESLHVARLNDLFI